MLSALINIWSLAFESIIEFQLAETSKYGILELDEDLKVQCLKEKPLLSETNSRNAVRFLLFV